MQQFYGFIELLCKKGAVLSGSFAVQHYLPERFRSAKHDDVDFILSIKKGSSPGHEIAKLAENTGVAEFKEMPMQQPRRRIFESRNVAGGRTAVVHVEVTDIAVPAKGAILNLPLGYPKVRAKIPDLNYLFARLLYGASMQTRPWHRKMDDISYLCQLLKFQKGGIQKQSVHYYSRGLFGGSAHFWEGMSRLGTAINAIAPVELAKRVANVRTKAQFDYLAGLKMLRDKYARKPVIDPFIPLSKKVRDLSPKHKEILRSQLGITKSGDAKLWQAVRARLEGMPPSQISRLNPANPNTFLKKLGRRRR